MMLLWLWSWWMESIQGVHPNQCWWMNSGIPFVLVGMQILWVAQAWKWSKGCSKGTAEPLSMTRLIEEALGGRKLSGFTSFVASSTPPSPGTGLELVLKSSILYRKGWEDLLHKLSNYIIDPCLNLNCRKKKLVILYNIVSLPSSSCIDRSASSFLLPNCNANYLISSIQMSCSVGLRVRPTHL